MEPIILLMILRPKGKVIRCLGLLVFLVDLEVGVHAISTIADQLVWDEVHPLVAKWRQGGVRNRKGWCERVDVIKHFEVDCVKQKQHIDRSAYISTIDP